jgi:hypothetical protein
MEAGPDGRLFLSFDFLFALGRNWRILTPR